MEGSVSSPLHVLFHDWVFHFLNGGAIYPEYCFFITYRSSSLGSIQNEQIEIL